MIEAAIFDMDGVVANTGLVHNTAEQKVLKDIGINLTFEEIRKYAGTTANVWFKKVLEKYNKTANIEELTKKKFEIVYNELEKNVPVVPGALELIDSLKKSGLKLALVSGSPKKFVDYIVSRLHLYEKLDIWLGYGDFLKSKPEPESYLLASKKLGVDPKNCVAFEDAYLGVLAVKRAGMKCVGYVNEYSGNQDLSKADLIVHDLSELSVDKIQNL